MYKKTLLSLAVASTLTLTGCLDSGSNNKNGDPDYKISNPATDGLTFAVFNPVTSELPIPNDLLFSGETDGTMSAGTDPTNPVITAIDFMDGNSVIGAFDIKFSGSLDANQTLDARSFISVGPSVIPNPGQNVFLLPLTFPSGDGLLHDDEVPTFTEGLEYQTAVALVTGGGAGAAVGAQMLADLAEPVARAELISLDGGTNNVLRLNPLTPLESETKYLVVITNSVVDAAGTPVIGSTQYQNLRDENATPGSASLLPVKEAISSWEQLAAGYFGFMQTVFDQADVGATAPSADDIVFSLTFTTGGTDSVLKSVAAPATFYDKSLTTGYKQDSIQKLVADTYNVNADHTGLTDGTDIAINITINFLLTSPFLDAPTNTVPNPLYDADLAAAIGAGATYSTLAADATAAFVMQKAAAEAANTVHDSGNENLYGAGIGDKDSFTIAQEAFGTAAALDAATPNGLPAPSPRVTNFYQFDCLGPQATCDATTNPALGATALNPALPAPAFVSQGEITLPYYHYLPTATDGSNIVTSTWQADAATGAAIDAGAGNESGTTPPSPMVTHRYPFPTQQDNVTVPVLATYPNAAVVNSISAGVSTKPYPVIIYQHGITTDRTATLPMADALAFSCINATQDGPSGLPCFATIAIDQPLHGVVPEGGTVPSLISVSDPNNVPTGNIGTPSADLGERHFNFTADATASPIPMNYTAGSELGSSGSLAINLSSLATTRDTLRQAAIDLMNLNASLGCMDIDGDDVPSWDAGTQTCTGAPDLDTTKIYFIGHSLGGVDGIPFVATNNNSDVLADGSNDTVSNTALPQVIAASLLNTGGGLAKFTENSQSTSFGAPVILQGLAASGLTQGTSDFESYMKVFQGVLDSSESMTFSDPLSDTDTGILVTEIIGDGADNPSDLTFPNGADTIWGDDNGPLQTTLDNGFVINSLPAPLTGTEPMIDQLGAVKTADIVVDGNPVIAVTRFTEGAHGNPISAGNTDAEEFSSAAVFTEMVIETATIFATGGTSVSVVNSAIVEP